MEGSEGKLLTPDEARQRILGRIRGVRGVDLTPENPINKPLRPEEVSRSQSLSGEALRIAQQQKALRQSLEQAKALKEASKPSPPETPVKKISRLQKDQSSSK